ncbi:MAG: zinc ribbon domain-containing protein [Armatimonadetes bacterium]|nr:zinc ribbon domain-containing protein [Armatimonadota bacterium]
MAQEILLPELLSKKGRELLSGEGSREAFFASLLEMEQKLEDGRASFLRSSAENPFSHQLYDEKTAVNDAFQQCKEVLDELRLYERGENRSRFASALFLLKFTVWQLEEAVQNYDRRHLLTGESKYPITNLLRRIAEAMGNGTLASEGVLPFFSLWKERFLAQVTKWRSEPEARTEEETLGFSGSLKAIESAFEELERAIRSGDPERLRTLTQTMDHEIKLLDSRCAAYLEERTRGPLPSALTNLLLWSLSRWEEGKIPEKDLTKFLAQYRSYVTDIRSNFEQACRYPASRISLQELATSTVNAFDRMEEALDAVKASLDMGEREKAATFAKDIEEAARALVFCYEGFRKEAEQPPGRPCPFCQGSVPPGSRSCPACKAVLPIGQEEQPFTVEFLEGEGVAVGQGVIMTTHLKRLLDAVSGALEQGDLSGLSATLDWLEGRLKEVSRTLSEYPLGDPERIEEWPLIQGTAQLLGDGLETYLRGISRIRDFTASGEKSCVTEGIEMVLSACSRLQQVQHIGKLADRTLERSQESPPGGLPSPPPLPSSVESDSFSESPLSRTLKGNSDS